MSGVTCDPMSLCIATLGSVARFSCSSPLINIECCFGKGHNCVRGGSHLQAHLVDPQPVCVLTALGKDVQVLIHQAASLKGHLALVHNTRQATPS